MGQLPLEAAFWDICGKWTPPGVICGGELILSHDEHFVWNIGRQKYVL